MIDRPGFSFSLLVVSRRSLLVALLLLFLNCDAIDLAAQVASVPVKGIKVPPGFEVTKIAADELATNVYSMAVNPKGEVFVAGPGYIKMLIDSDADGVFDKARKFSDGPRSGAMGMCFDGNDLLCCGDGSVLRYVDFDGDGVSDEKPVSIFRIKTGGEHDAHSIRKGPDGWWYLLAGNGVPILPEYYANKNSPVKNPRAGFLMRISPDWKEKQIYGHGFRNAYDFDFNSLGEIFVYDSDGERDISLPWYRPTRVFRMRPGDDAGFVSRSWKRPSYFYDMPPTVGKLGRGSPTGVVVGNSNQFPQDYEDAIFVADWTFGRVVAFHRDLDARYDKGTEFAIADGQFGFAVTDLDFAKDGSLLISVGGRGTEGAIYQVRFVGTKNSPDVNGKISSPKPKVLSKTQQFVLDSKTKPLDCDDLISGIDSDLPRIREAALESLILFPEIWKSQEASVDNKQVELIKSLKSVVERAEPNEIVLLHRAYLEMPLNYQKATRQGFVSVQFAAGETASASFNRKLSEVELTRLFEAMQSRLESGKATVDLVRQLQLALGSCAAKSNKPMFDGYTARLTPEFDSAAFKKYTLIISDAIKTSESETVRYELARLGAMFGFSSTRLHEELVKQISLGSSAPDDIHFLNCLARVTSKENPLSAELKISVAEAVLNLGSKLKRDNLEVDRNYYPRLSELASSLFSNNPGLESEVASRLSGVESQIFLFESFSRKTSEGEKARELAFKRFSEKVNREPADVSGKVLSVLASDGQGRYLSLIRKFSDRADLRSVVVSSVARKPIESDRRMLVGALKASDLTTVKNGAIGLRRLFDKPRTDELIKAFRAASQLGWDRPSVSVRDQLMLLAEKHTGQPATSFGYIKKKQTDQSPAMKNLAKWLHQNHAAEFEAAFANDSQLELLTRLDSIDWTVGDAKRGRVLYQKLQCAQCHDGGSRLGPRLEGISKRFGRDDLFKSIVNPDQQVPERYRALLIETVDGKLYLGSMVYESVDGITLQEVGGGTVRINKDDIEDRIRSRKSLMPKGLLDQSSDQDLADLFQFLNSK